MGEWWGKERACCRLSARQPLHRGTHSRQLPRLLFVTPRMMEKTRLKEDDATCSVYAMADEL